MEIVDLIDAPVVGAFPGQFTGIVILVSECLRALILRRCFGGISYSLLVHPKVQLVRHGLKPWFPLKHWRLRHIHSAVRRLGAVGPHWLIGCEIAAGNDRPCRHAGTLPGDLTMIAAGAFLPQRHDVVSSAAHERDWFGLLFAGRPHVKIRISTLPGNEPDVGRIAIDAQPQFTLVVAVKPESIVTGRRRVKPAVNPTAIIVGIRPVPRKLCHHLGHVRIVRESGIVLESVQIIAADIFPPFGDGRAQARNSRRKAPDIPPVCSRAVEFVHAPEVRFVELKRARVITCVRLWEPSRRVIHIVEILTEIHSVQPCTHTCRPTESQIRIDEHSPVCRTRIVSLYRRNEKAPDLTLPGTVRVRLVDLVDSPVIRRTRHKAFGKSESGKACNIKRRRLVALECFAGSVVHIVKVVAEIDIV